MIEDEQDELNDIVEHYLEHYYLPPGSEEFKLLQRERNMQMAKLAELFNHNIKDNNDNSSLGWRDAGV